MLFSFEGIIERFGSNDLEAVGVAVIVGIVENTTEGTALGFNDATFDGTGVFIELG